MAESPARPSLPSRVLVVEDDPSLRGALDRALRAAGYRVTLAPSFTTALANGGPFACGVFDILLPDGNGIDAAEELLSRGSVEKAVFYSATTDERMWLRAQSGGVFVHKKDGIVRLVEQITQLIHES